MRRWAGSRLYERSGGRSSSGSSARRTCPWSTLACCGAASTTEPRGSGRSSAASRRSSTIRPTACARLMRRADEVCGRRGRVFTRLRSFPQLEVRSATGRQAFDAVPSPARRRRCSRSFRSSAVVTQRESPRLRSLRCRRPHLLAQAAVDQRVLAQPAEGCRLPFLALVEHTNFLGPSTTAATTSSTAAITCRRRIRTSPSTRTISSGSSPSLKALQPAFEESWVRQTWLCAPATRNRCRLSITRGTSRAADSRSRSLLRQHEPGLPARSRHELRRGARPPRRLAHDGRSGARSRPARFAVPSALDARFRATHTRCAWRGFAIVGGQRLRGEVRVSGAKNAALPCLAATLADQGAGRPHEPAARARHRDHGEGPRDSRRVVPARGRLHDRGRRAPATLSRSV